MTVDDQTTRIIIRRKGTDEVVYDGPQPVDTSGLAPGEHEFFTYLDEGDLRIVGPWGELEHRRQRLARSYDEAEALYQEIERLRTALGEQTAKNAALLNRVRRLEKTRLAWRRRAEGQQGPRSERSGS